MKPKVIVGVIAIIGFTSLLFYNFGNSISMYVSFNQASSEHGDNVHVVGTWDQARPSGFSYDTKTFSFFMKDQSGDIRKVVYSNPKPNNFDDAKKIVVIGEMKNNVFYASNILMKCPSKYNATGENLKPKGEAKS